MWYSERQPAVLGFALSLSPWGVQKDGRINIMILCVRYVWRYMVTQNREIYGMKSWIKFCARMDSKQSMSGRVYIIYIIASLVQTGAKVNYS